MFKEDETQYCKNCYELRGQLDQLKASLNEKNDLLQKLGISATGEFKRIKYYVDKIVKENDELKQYKEDSEQVLKNILDNFDKMENHYKQTLTEIKEIAEIKQKQSVFVGETVFGQILNKISECEGNDENS